MPLQHCQERGNDKFRTPIPCAEGRSLERGEMPPPTSDLFLQDKMEQILSQSFHVTDGTNPFDSSIGFHFDGKLQGHCSLWRIRFGGDDGIQMRIVPAPNCILNQCIKDRFPIEYNDACRRERTVEVIANERKLLMRECTNPNNEMVKQKTDETLKQLLCMKVICNRWLSAGLNPFHFRKTHAFHNRSNGFD